MVGIPPQRIHQNRTPFSGGPNDQTVCGLALAWGDI